MRGSALIGSTKIRFTPDSVLDTLPEGLVLIRQAESFVPTWYRDAVGVWTLGYGITESALAMMGLSRSDVPGPITEPQARRLLVRFVAGHVEPVIEHAVQVPMTRGQFSALVSFTYNVGAGAFRRSTLLRTLNAGRYEEAGRELLRWVWADGRRLRGLVRRRRAELALYRSAPRPALEEALRRLEPLEPVPVRSGRRSLRDRARDALTRLTR